MNPVTVLMILAFVGYYYYTLVSVMRFNPRRLWLLPLIVGFFVLSNVPGDLFRNDRTLLATLLSLVLGVATGVYQGYAMTVFRGPDGSYWQKGSLKAVLVLLLTLPLRFGIRIVLIGVPIAGSAASLASNSDLVFGLLITGFAVVAARAATLTLRYPEIQELIFA